MDGRESSLSLQGEAFPRPQSGSGNRHNYRYKVIGKSASVDETLFGSHRDVHKVTGKKLKESGNSQNVLNLDQSKRTVSPHIKTSLHSTPQSRKDFRVSNKSRPSYVDETLFGKKLDMPDFEPPWAEKKDPRFQDPPLSWSPPVAGSLCDTPRSRTASAQGQRSSSRLSQRSSSSVGSRPGSARGGRKSQPSEKPPWR